MSLVTIKRLAALLLLASLLPAKLKLFHTGTEPRHYLAGDPDDQLIPESANRLFITDAGGRCDGTHDDTAAFQLLISTKAGSIRLPANSTCVISSIFISPSTRRLILDLNGGTLRFTGDGGGACGQNKNGLIQVRSGVLTMKDGQIEVVNPHANCLFNFSQIGQGDNYIHGFNLDNLWLTGTPQTKELIGIYAYRSGELVITRTAFNFLKTALYSDEQFDIVKLDQNNFGVNFGDGFNVIINGNPQAVEINNNNFELHGAHITPNTYSTISFTNNWLGDGCPSVGHDINAASSTISSNFIFYPSCPPGSTAVGIRVAAGTPLISGNNITAPIAISTGVSARIEGNSIVSNIVGIDVRGGRSTVEHNAISGGKTGVGIRLSGTQNVIGLNTFFSTAHAVDCGGTKQNELRITNVAELYRCSLTENAIFTAQNAPGALQSLAAESLPYSPTPTFSVSTVTSYMYLAGDVSFKLATGADGQIKKLAFCQDQHGRHKVNSPSNVRGLRVSPDPNSCTVSTLTYFNEIGAWMVDGVTLR